ncbi:MAG TPA: DUF6766 family protein [Candidatus Saccharimonadales bacterium]|nr:DUF6766 family protein [Candidatus Saccharimonadales bacterium]
MTVREYFKQHGLATAMFGIFFVAIVAMSLSGWMSENEEKQEHSAAQIPYGEYVTSGHFVEAVFENWESEFLQMWALVILTVFLYQKGSADSKPLKGGAPQDTTSRLSIIHARSWRQRKKAIGHAVYAHSLGLALLALFLGSFILHALGGAEAYNDEARQHGQATVSVAEYMITPRFWFESFQNWQSEFLAVGVLIILSIYLRERGSQQSKPVGKHYNDQTGD